MIIINTTAKLIDFCTHASSQSFITIDTEFMREKTYYSILCLVQIATDEQAVIIDPLSKNINLCPLYELLSNPKVEKVFHAAKQDVEIFYFATGQIPTPIFDTQVAAMALGYGDQVGYETLVQRILKKSIDKGARFTDWSKRPLSENQLQYALGDVTHLIDVYKHLKSQLISTGRSDWIYEEMKGITTPSVYDMPPETAYKRVKGRINTPRNLAILQKICAIREIVAQQEDRPRRHILKDDSLMDIAGNKPTTIRKLAKTRSIPSNIENSKIGKMLLQAVSEAMAIHENDLPVIKRSTPITDGQQAVVDLLKALLKDCSEKNNITPRLLANNDDLKNIACNDKPNCLALTGWRNELFGKRAMNLKNGKTALAVKEGKLTFIDLD